MLYYAVGGERQLSQRASYDNRIATITINRIATINISRTGTTNRIANREPVGQPEGSAKLGALETELAEAPYRLYIYIYIHVMCVYIYIYIYIYTYIQLLLLLVLILLLVV